MSDQTPFFKYLSAKKINHGDIASDLYGPQFWDDNFQFSFSVVVSCKSNKQLGYFWWKMNVKLKNFVYPFWAHFCKSHVQTWHLCIFPGLHDRMLIECWWTKKNASSHSHFHHWYKKPSFLRIGQHLGTPEVFLKSIPFPTDASLSWLDTYILLVISWKLTFKCRSKEFVWIVNCNGK